MWDVFISHASEDKEFVDQLANALRDKGVKVWYDSFTLKLGDRLGESIDKGLSESRYGLVVFSHAFFNKSWTKYELSGLVHREVSHRKTILPIWHNISASDVARYSPSLANKLAVSSNNDLDYVVSQILDVIGTPAAHDPSLTSRTTTSVPTKRQPIGQVNPIRLREAIINGFNVSELQDLAFYLGISYEDLGGSGKSDKVRELIGYLQRRGRLADLVSYVRQERPHLTL